MGAVVCLSAALFSTRCLFEVLAQVRVVKAGLADKDAQRTRHTEASAKEE